MRPAAGSPLLALAALTVAAAPACRQGPPQPLIGPGAPDAAPAEVAGRSHILLERRIKIVLNFRKTVPA